MEKTEFWTALADSLEVKPSELSLKFDLPGKGNWDSLALLSSVSIIDKYFNLAVKACELENCQTVGDLCSLINQRLCVKQGI
jgi:acyl carrier protein